MARDCTAARQLMQIIGIGEVTATAIVATVGNAREFSSSRQFAAWLGLVPGPYSSGGKDDGISRWAKNIALRRGYWKAVVAVAAKNARLAWAALTKGESFTMPA